MSLHLLLTGQPRYLRERGVEVVMVSADGPELPAVRANEGCRHVIVPFTRAITPLQDLRCLWQLIRLMWRLRPDIVHTHTPKAGLLGMLAARLTGVPVRIHTIGGLPFMTARGNRRRLLMAMERLTYWGAQHVWPNSPSLLAYIRELRLCPERKLAMIGAGSTNGIDLTRFSPGAVSEQRRIAARAEIDHAADCTYLLAIGRVVRDKGIPELVRAFAQLHADQPSLRLVLVGPLEKERAAEALPPETLDMIESHPAIRHVPWTEDVPAFLAAADVLVHASHREGFPNVLLQAGAMECPIVCSVIPGNVDIVTNGATGLTFPVGDEAALRAALQATLADPAAARDRAMRLRQEIVQRYDRRVIHRLLLERYRELVGEGASG
jgi:glycosyltransferase involved in cell wall biosynthesis